LVEGSNTGKTTFDLSGQCDVASFLQGMGYSLCALVAFFHGPNKAGSTLLLDITAEIFPSMPARTAKTLAGNYCNKANLGWEIRLEFCGIDFSNFGPFGLRNLHRNFIFSIVKCVPANSEQVFSSSESSPTIYSSDFMNQKTFPPWHNFAPNLHLLM
jgi:hypothetical protein